jgi:hypothetical protein
MGTKNKPSTYDCYSNADPDEPMFILLGRDRSAAKLVDLWADIREKTGESPAKIEEARNCARSMREWLRSLEKTELDATIVIGSEKDEILEKSAPDLLSALKALATAAFQATREDGDISELDGSFIDDAWAAIAKAEGCCQPE